MLKAAKRALGIAILGAYVVGFAPIPGTEEQIIERPNLPRS
jgi:hypothetical protein